MKGAARANSELQESGPAVAPESHRPIASIARAGDHVGAVERLLARFGLIAALAQPGAEIPGSYWGESEAGLIGDRLHFRLDTPLHSVLHEACHYICMDDARRARLDRDAGGDYDEENAVCYLQILLAGAFTGCGPERMCADMDAWGYTFRLGSARAWFERDAQDARAWLIRHGIIDERGRPTGSLRVVSGP